METLMESAVRLIVQGLLSAINALEELFQLLWCVLLYVETELSLHQRLVKMMILEILNQETVVLQHVF